MTNKRESSSIFSIQPQRSHHPDHNGNKIESSSARSNNNNLLVKRNGTTTTKHNQENHKKFNDGGGVASNMVHAGPHVHHDGTHNEEGGSMRTEENGSDRLKRHRIEVAGRVWIPEIWGKEELLKDWIDCSAFDATLMNNKIMSARNALVEERRRANSTLRIENSY